MNYEFQILPKEDAFVAGAFVFMRNRLIRSFEREMRKK